MFDSVHLVKYVNVIKGVLYFFEGSPVVLLVQIIHKYCIMLLEVMNERYGTFLCCSSVHISVFSSAAAKGNVLL